MKCKNIVFALPLMICISLSACSETSNKDMKPTDGISITASTPTQESESQTDNISLSDPMNVTKAVEYESVEVTDILALYAQENKGVEIDLNGDGKADRISCRGGKLVINDEVYNAPLYQDWYLLDIVKDDCMVELLIRDEFQQFYMLAHYTAEGTLKWLTEGIRMGENQFPVFVDDKTVRLHRRLYVLDQYGMYVDCTLNENGEIVIIPGDYYTEAEWLLTTKKEVKLYAQKDLAGEYTVLTAGQQVRQTKTDCRNWTFLIAEDGTQGWVYTDEDGLNGEGSSEDYFAGFNTAG